MSLLLKHTAPLWGIWKMEESSDELYSLLLNGEVYLSQLEQLHTEQRRQEWLAARVLLQELVGKAVQVAYHPNGAPYLLNDSKSISISHTKGYVAVRIQELSAAGIDIEYRSDRVLRIRSRFMDSNEEAAIDKRHETDHLLLHWCAKETLFKLIGAEEVDFIEHLHVEPFLYAKEGSFTVYETRTESGSHYQLNYLVTSDFVCTYSQ